MEYVKNALLIVQHAQSQFPNAKHVKTAITCSIMRAIRHVPMAIMRLELFASHASLLARNAQTEKANAFLA